jgi:hypothetical protein
MISERRKSAMRPEPGSYEKSVLADYAGALFNRWMI